MGSTSLLLPVNTSLSSSSLTMVEQLLGSYDLDRNENFEEFLAATGVPLIARKMMVSVSPKITIAKEEDRITITFKNPHKILPAHFRAWKGVYRGQPYFGREKQVHCGGERGGTLHQDNSHEFWSQLNPDLLSHGGRNNCDTGSRGEGCSGEEVL